MVGLLGRVESVVLARWEEIHEVQGLGISGGWSGCTCVCSPLNSSRKRSSRKRATKTFVLSVLKCILVPVARASCVGN